MAIRRIGLVVNDGKSEANAAARIVRAWAGEHGVSCRDIDVWEDLDASSEITDRQQAAGLADEVGWGVPVDIVAENDVVVEKLARDRQASLTIYVSGRLFASYSADAVIVATPTGSTAYSFSVGGPVLSPQLDALVFTPVAAHMVFNRSLVLAPDEAVSVRVLERSGRVAVNVDGQLRGVLDPGDWIRVFAGPKRARRVQLKPTDFFTRVRDRLGLLDARLRSPTANHPLIYRPDQPVPPDMAYLRQPR